MNMKNHYGILFNRNKGNIVKTLEGYSSGMMQLWALQGNVSATRDFVIFDEDGEIQFYCEGKKNDMPTVHRDMKGLHIDSICEGLLEAMKN
jgi:uncharacterized protein YxjI